MLITMAGDRKIQGSLDLDGKELLNVRAQNLAADPGTPAGNGQFFYRTDTHKIRARINGAWQDLATMSDVTAGGMSVALYDAKGDLLAGTGADAVARLPVGTDNQILIADSTQTTGLRWGAAPATYTDEQAQDAVGTILTDSTTIDFTYNDATPSITAIVLDTSITNAKLATVPANTIKGNNTAGVAAPTDLTTAQVKAMLAIAPADVTFAAASRLLGRGSAGGAGAGQEITLGGGVEMSGTAIQTSAYTGDVTKAAGGTATTIANDVVTNAKLANMAANTIKGNNTGSAADPLDLTAAQVKTLLAIVPADVTGFDTQVRTNRLDQMAAPTAAVAFNNQKITGLADGTNATDAATFGQISALMSAQQWKDPVDAATTANVANLATGAPNTIDGVTLTVGARVLVKNQTTPAQNGIYTVTTVGTGANGVWARSTDADTAAELTDATVLVQEGTDAKGDIYTFPTITTLGTTDATPVKTGEGNTVYTADGTTIELNGTAFRIATGAAGNGLTGGGGSALAVNPGFGIDIASDAVRIAAEAAGAGLTGGAGSALAVGQGTGISVTADAVAIDTAVVVRKATGTLTGGSNTEVITHNLNTRNVRVTIRNNASPYEEIEVPNEATTVNTVTLGVGTGYTLPAGYTWMVMG
jgi:hypothetical protein